MPCGSTPRRTAPTPIENIAPAKPRATPAPSIAWADNKLALTGLPAVARGGEVIVVVPISGGDAGRGYPNLKLEIHDRSDKTVQTIDVLTSNEYEQLAPGGVARRRCRSASPLRTPS